MAQRCEISQFLIRNIIVLVSLSWYVWISIVSLKLN